MTTLRHLIWLTFFNILRTPSRITWLARKLYWRVKYRNETPIMRDIMIMGEMQLMLKQLEETEK